MAWATIVIKLVGGLAILVGAFVPVVTIPMIVVLLVAWEAVTGNPMLDRLAA